MTWWARPLKAQVATLPDMELRTLLKTAGSGRGAARAGGHAGSHTDEQPSDVSDPLVQPGETSPRSRTDLNGSGCPHRNLRIRRLGVRVPPSAPMFSQARALFSKVAKKLNFWRGARRLTISHSPKRSCESWRARLGLAAGLPRLRDVSLLRERRVVVTGPLADDQGGVLRAPLARPPPGSALGAPARHGRAALASSRRSKTLIRHA